MKVTKYTEVEVDVDLDDFSTEDLIETLESHGYVVIDKDSDDAPAYYQKHIHTLKEDFINWYQFGMKNENFEKTMKQFFKDTIDEYIA